MCKECLSLPAGPAYAPVAVGSWKFASHEMCRMEKRKREGLTRRLQASSNAVEGHGLVLGDSCFLPRRPWLAKTIDEIDRCALFLDIQIELKDSLIPWQVLPSSHLWQGSRKIDKSFSSLKRMQISHAALVVTDF